MEPTQIIDLPIPLLNGSFSSTFGTTTDPVVADSGASVPTTHVDKAFPQANIAVETISQSLNTETKSILGEYTFESLGAFRVGKFSQGVSGEIDLSPDGIAAKNSNGDETFTIDGKTGDATFAGIVKAADVEVIDKNGLISLASFTSDSVTSAATFTTTSSSYTDITDMTLTTPDFPRPVKALILATADAYVDRQSGGDYSGDIGIGVNINGSIDAKMRQRGQTITGADGDVLSNSDVTTLSTHEFVNLPSGISTIKLQMVIAQTGTGNAKGGGLAFKLSYIILGR